MAKRKPIQQPGVPEWVLTYGDLMSLLLCFFILLAAFSELKQPREYQKVIDAIKEALGSTGGIGIAELNEAIKQSIVSVDPELAKRDAQRRNVDSNNVPAVPGRHSQTNVVHQTDRTAIGASIPFEPGQYHLSATTERQLKFDIAPKIRDQRYIVHVTGHAWGQADKAASGMSHGLLSYHRAEAVIDYLVRECGVSPQILRNMASADQEPVTAAVDIGDATLSNRRVQLYQTGHTVEQLHPDPNFTGRGE